MISLRQRTRTLILVKTYPTPAWRGGEVVCTAGLTAEGQWIRLFPIPYRLLSDDRRFRKYQWIEAEVRKARSDVRLESFQVDVDSLKVVGKPIATDHYWHERRGLVLPHTAPSMCWLRQKRDATGSPTLGLVRPRILRRLRIVATDKDWSPSELARLNQLRLIESGPQEQLEKIPFDFYYDFTCQDPECKGHEMSCTDWGMAQAYRNYIRRYGRGWEEKFRQRFEDEMIEKNDTHFFVGTVHGNPRSWVVVGLFYPRKSPASLQAALFK